jgi:hypothetical protein
MAAAANFCVRHIPIPDLPPHYPPFWVAKEIETYVFRTLVSRTSSSREQPSAGGLATSPIVISFTPHPTFMVKKSKSKAYTKTARRPLAIAFPQLPGALSGQPSVDGHPIEAEAIYTPEEAELALARPRYQGPGQLVLLSILEHARHGGDEKREHQQLVGDTTVALLKREFGLVATVDSDRAGISVVSSADGLSRSIGSLWPSHGAATISSFAMTLNVSQPAVFEPLAEAGKPDPSDDRADEGLRTSIEAELTSLGEVPRAAENERRLVQVRASRITPLQPPAWYTSTRSAGQPAGTYAPLGMDNYALSASWAYELAVQIGASPPTVQQYANRAWSSSWAPADSLGALRRPTVELQTAQEYRQTKQKIHRSKQLLWYPARVAGTEGVSPGWHVVVHQAKKSIRQALIGKGQEQIGSIPVEGGPTYGKDESRYGDS